jgi:hypothetical protein
VNCKEGLIHLEGYRKAWNERLGCWSDQPVKNVHTEGADSFRQFAQSIQSAGNISPTIGAKIQYKRKWL